MSGCLASREGVHKSQVHKSPDNRGEGPVSPAQHFPSGRGWGAGQRDQKRVRERVRGVSTWSSSGSRAAELGIRQSLFPFPPRHSGPTSAALVVSVATGLGPAMGRVGATSAASQCGHGTPGQSWELCQALGAHPEIGRAPEPDQQVDSPVVRGQAHRVKLWVFG